MNTRRSPPAPLAPPAAADDVGPTPATAVRGAPVTLARPVRTVPGVPDAGTPRAETAPRADTPHPAAPWPAHSVLQAHVAFFDRGEKGWITPADVYTGFRKLGFGVVLSTIAAVVIATSFTWPTTTGWKARPSLSVNVAAIHAAKHGSDSGTFDNEGRFVPARFDAAFTRAAGTAAPGGAAAALTWPQVRALLAADRVARDPFGWVAAFLEWGALFYVAAQRLTPDGPYVLTRARRHGRHAVARAGARSGGAARGGEWQEGEGDAPPPRVVKREGGKEGRREEEERERTSHPSTTIFSFECFIFSLSR